MSPITTLLQKCTVATIRGWLSEAGADYDRKTAKYDLIRLAIANPASIPISTRLAATPPLTIPGKERAGQANNSDENIIQPPAQPSNSALETSILSLQDLVAGLAEQVSTLTAQHSRRLEHGRLEILTLMSAQTSSISLFHPVMERWKCPDPRYTAECFHGIENLTGIGINAGLPDHQRSRRNSQRIVASM